MDVTAAIALCAVVVAGVSCLAVFQFVPGGHQAIVTRAGMPTRSKAGGIVAALPGLERIHMVPTNPAAIDPLAAQALTRDGVEVQLVVSVLFRITNPAMAIASATDARMTTADAVERAIHHLIGQSDLIDVLRERESLLAQLVEHPPTLLERTGVELVDVDLLEVEIRVGAQLLHLLEEAQYSTGPDDH